MAFKRQSVFVSESGDVVLGQAERGQKHGAMAFVRAVALTALREDRRPVATASAHSTWNRMAALARLATTRLARLALREHHELPGMEIPLEQTGCTGTIDARDGASLHAAPRSWVAGWVARVTSCSGAVRPCPVFRGVVCLGEWPRMDMQWLALDCGASPSKCGGSNPLGVRVPRPPLTAATSPVFDGQSVIMPRVAAWVALLCISPPSAVHGPARAVPPRHSA